MVNTLLETKKQLHEAAAEFDSKATIKTTKTVLGTNIQAGVVSAETFVEQLGLFKAIDGLVQAMADVPAKLNEAANAAELDAEVDLQKAIGNVIDAKINALQVEELAQAFFNQEMEELVEDEEAEEQDEEAALLKALEPAVAAAAVDVEVHVNGDVAMETTE